jgi:anaerobic selenocysteine-containing dehydrogenase
MTNHWVDIKNADLVLVMGGNPAEAHPCGFKWVIEAKKNRKAKLVVVDPRFNRTASVADYYAPLRPGTDIAFLGGVINYLLPTTRFITITSSVHQRLLPDRRRLQVRGRHLLRLQRREAQLRQGHLEIPDGQGRFRQGRRDPAGPELRLPADEGPLFARYTPEMVSKVCGTPKDAFLKVCEYIAETAAPNKTMTNLYALGWTEHSVGSQNIRCMAIIQLLLGNMGMAGGGINALRGHANVQGITDFALYAQNLPGYVACRWMPTSTARPISTKRTPKPLRPGQMNFAQNFPKWHTSLPRPGGATPRPRKTTSPTTTSRNWPGRRTCCRSSTPCTKARSTASSVRASTRWPQWPTRRRSPTRWPS